MNGSIIVNFYLNKLIDIDKMLRFNFYKFKMPDIVKGLSEILDIHAQYWAVLTLINESFDRPLGQIFSMYFDTHSACWTISNPNTNPKFITSEMMDAQISVGIQNKRQILGYDPSLWELMVLPGDYFATHEETNPVKPPRLLNP
jgi:hypothetical protein